MTSTELLTDAFGRVHDVVHDAVDGLTPEELAFRVNGSANSIAWLVWHLSRITDDHIAEAAGLEQVWISGGWMDRFGLPFGARATGYGHGGDDVAAVQVKSAELLTGYFDAAYEQAIRFVKGLSEDDIAHLEGLGYSRTDDEALQLVLSGEYDAAFFLRSTPIEQVRAIAAAGVNMPPKSTYFFPKVPTGLLFNPLL